MDLKKLLVRASSGLIYVGIIIGCIFWGLIPVACMASVFAILACIEFARITHELDSRNLPHLILDIAGCVCLCFGAWIYPLLAWIAILMFRMIEQLYNTGSNPLADIAHSMMTQLYIGLPMGLMVATGDLYSTTHVLLAIFFFIWINDTGAFLVGSMLGRHRLFERISPKKSWEGFFGGLLFNIVASILFCVLCSGFFGLPSSLALWIGLGVIVTVLATWGDLVESMIKRSLGIKDSGNLIPGHGGILDRIDSTLFVMPASFIYLIIYRLSSSALFSL